MAHGLLEYDWMLSAKERPWHGLGTVIQVMKESKNILRRTR